MRHISYTLIKESIKNLCIDANTEIRPDVLEAFHLAREKEKSPLGKEVLSQLIENAKIAKEKRLAFCQDTGYAVVFVEMGQNIFIEGGLLAEAINEGVREGYSKGYLRKSILKSPIERVNTEDNTPATIHINLVAGDKLQLSVLIKGCGCDNMSALKMLTPAKGLEAAKDFIVKTVEEAGPNASPPIVMGIGMGGPFAEAALLAQKSLLWPLNQPNPDIRLAEIELELMERINNLGIGPAGYGGTQTILGLHIEMGAVHMASLPVACNIACHSHRSKTILL